MRSISCTAVWGCKKQNPAEVDGGLFLLQPGQAWNPGGGGLFLFSFWSRSISLKSCKGHKSCSHEQSVHEAWTLEHRVSSSCSKFSSMQPLASSDSPLSLSFSSKLLFRLLLPLQVWSTPQKEHVHLLHHLDCHYRYLCHRSAPQIHHFCCFSPQNSQPCFSSRICFFGASGKAYIWALWPFGNGVIQILVTVWNKSWQRQ